MFKSNIYKERSNNVKKMLNVHWLFYQVLRYHQNGEPLWVSDEGKPSDGDIPKCECGSDRVFEFQVITLIQIRTCPKIAYV